MPACGLRRGSKGGPARPIFINTDSRPSRGAKPRGADDAELPQARPHQESSRRGGDIKARRTSRGSRDVSHDDRHQAGASARSVLVSPLVQRRQAQPWSTEASGKGCHFGATRPRPPGRQAGGHRRAHRSITTRGFSQAKTTLVRIGCTSCLPSNLAIVGSLPAFILGEENQGLYK